jgi:uncharacterized membrane protein (DUF485 family)
MTQDVNEKIIQNPKFCELTTKRNRFSLTLLAVTLVVYFTFVFTAVFAPQIFSLPLTAA